VTERPTILLIDDDPSHLKLYSWIVDRGGFRPLAALVIGRQLELPTNEPVALTILDYRLGHELKSIDVAKQLIQLFPSKPVLVLSDYQWLPDDIAPYATGFVRKGEPEQLLQQIRALTGEQSQH